jgi:hypothetical protein
MKYLTLIFFSYNDNKIEEAFIAAFCKIANPSACIVYPMNSNWIFKNGIWGKFSPAKDRLIKLLKKT